MGFRTFDRIPVLIDIKINCNNMVVTGTLINISEHGMFIRTNRMPSPIQSQIDITIPLKDESIHISGKIVREENIQGYYNGVGVEVLNPPQNYLDFIDNLITVL
ncbi:MAG: PilZ domain-containing protein [Nitrospirae bacterium]|nr:PilZ domain-containing protein [Nitrospirota bacterium]